MSSILHGKHRVGHPVDVASGVLYSSFSDFALPGRMGLEFRRNYSTALLGRENGALGPGWWSPLFSTLQQSRDGIVYRDAEGGATVFAGDGTLPAEGDSIRHLGGFVELAREGPNRLVVTKWNPPTLVVHRQVFERRGPAGDWPLIRIEDPAGQAVEIERDSAGRAVRVAQRRERRGLELQYGSQGRLESLWVAVPGGIRVPVARYEYDAAGRLNAVFDALETAERFEYDTEDRMIRAVYRDGGIWTFQFDAEGRCVYTSGADRYEERRLRFHANSNVTEVIDSHGGVKLFQWLPSGQVSRVVTPRGAQYLTNYDEHGRIVETADPLGATSRRAYDEAGNLSEVTNAVGATWNFRFNARRQLVEFTNPEGNRWQREYDRRGRISALNGPLGMQVAFEWSEAGDLMSFRNDRGHQRAYQYNEHGDMVRGTDYDGTATTYRYNDLGQVVERTDPLGQRTRYSYDGLRRLSSITLPNGGTLRYSYDSGGNRTRLVGFDGSVTSYTYGPCGRIAELVEPDGLRIGFEWDTEPNRLLRVSLPEGRSYRYEYDEDGHRASEIDFDGRTIRYERDLAGRHVAVRNGAGEQTQYRYDQAGRLVQKIGFDGRVTEYAYNQLNLMTLARNPDTEVSFARDELGRVVSERQDEYAVSSSYDAFGLRTGRATSLGHRVSYDYGPSALLSGLLIDGRHRFELERDPVGREIRRFLPGGTELRQRYDPAGQLVEQWVSAAVRGRWSDQPPAQTVVHRRYGYTASGEVDEMVDGAWGATSYSYDAMHRLLSAVSERGASERFSYDAVGNRMVYGRTDGEGRAALEIGYTYGGGNQVTSADGTRFQYDGEGRLVRKTERGAGGQPATWQYEWNSDGGIAAVVRPDGERWSYRYDALGRRIEKSGPQTRVRYVWDQHEVVHEITSGGQATSWVTDPGNHRPIAKVADQNIYSCVTDQIGLPRELIDGDGRIAWSARFLAWGALQDGTGAPQACPRRFPGQWHDAESGLHYNRFRYYAPDTGLFLSRDPLRINAGLLEYAYAPNPLMWLDPSGLNGTNDTTVYVVREGNDPDGRVVYVGITNQPVADRQAQHQGVSGREDWVLMPLTDANGNELRVDRGTARGVEQGLIDHYGLDNLENKINSMSPNNPNRDARMEAGEEHVDRFLQGEEEDEEENTC